MRYFKNPKDEVYGYDETYENDLPYIEAAIEAGWEDVTSSWSPISEPIPEPVPLTIEEKLTNTGLTGNIQ